MLGQIMEIHGTLFYNSLLLSTALLGPSQVSASPSHSQVISLQFKVKSQVISPQVQVKSQISHQQPRAQVQSCHCLII